MLEEAQPTQHVTAQGSFMVKLGLWDGFILI